ncbi:MAG: hypothetical protein WEC59_02200 [Salibacteraceae bacterium]
MLRKLTLFIPISITVFLCSCSTESTTDLSEDLGNVPFKRSIDIDTSLVIINKTTDFCEWRSVFKASTPDMNEHGLNLMDSYQGLEDTNLALTFHAVSNLETAQAFMESSASSEPFKSVTANDELTSMFLDQQLEYTREAKDTLVMFMSFKTMKYERWEEAFLDDYREDSTKDFQVLRVFRGLEDRDHVYMLFKVNDPNYIERTEKNNAFKMKMLAAGVVSYPVSYKLFPAEV